MTVFKTFWKVVKKYKGTVIMYTVILLTFGMINMQSSTNDLNFVNVKPDVLVVNNDNSKISNNLVKYIENNSNKKDIKLDEESINDALFYRNVNYIIYIPKGYGENILNGISPEIEIKSTGDYAASLAELLLSRYVKVQNVYQTKLQNEDELINAINENLSKESNISVASKLDISKTTNAAIYFDFASYSIMAVVIYIVCLVLSSFKEKSIRKRTIISSTNYKKNNRMLLISSFVYSCIVWLLYVIFSAIILKDIMFTTRGLIYISNCFIFTFCCLTIALLISNLINDKNAVSGIVNVVALGSAFLCGAFIPSEWLPDMVLKVAHALPSYWYINSNDLLKTIEVINLETLKPIFLNMLVLIVFSCLFIILNNFVSKKKQKVG